MYRIIISKLHFLRFSTRSFFLCIHLLFFQAYCLKAQTNQIPDSLQAHYKKSYFITHATGGALLYAGLYSIWFSDYNNGRFYFFNDNKEWMGLDKCGHAYSNFQITSVLTQQYYYAGFNKRKASIIGWGMSNAYFLGIEIMDGFSEGWGFSYGDILANITGSTLATLEYWLWDEPKINFKFCYASSPYAKYRPNLLGNNFPSKLIKDYNAQSYWLTVSPFAFTHNNAQWLSAVQVAVGYGANGMIAAEINKQKQIGFGNVARYKQYFFSLDVDWTKLPIKNQKLKSFCKYLNLIKMPLPYLAFENNTTSFYWWPKY